MSFEVVATPWTAADCDWLMIGVPESPDITGPLAELDAALGGQIGRLRESQDLTGKLAELVPVRDCPGIKARRILFVGLGAVEKLHEGNLQKALATGARSITSKDKQSVAVGLAVGPLPQEHARAAAIALTVSGVGQDLYRSEKQRFPLANVRLLASSPEEAAGLAPAFEEGRILGEAINLTRELVNEPPHAIYPVSFADRAEKVAAECGLKCEILDQPALEKERMGSLLAVAKGSEQPPRIVVLTHQGGGAGSPTLALCGKGVTFDSGGLSLKTNDGMLTMKCDMAGAATVLGAMTAIARLKLPVNVVGYMGLVENMPSGSSFKLGDVLTARNGVTIEVHNTDAEGRLVLADVLSYAVDRGATHLVDLATLTGACVVALGEEVVGAFTNEQAWCTQLLTAAESSHEDVWQMPMHDHFADLIKSEVADIKNVGGRWGGAITAAKFLERFVGGKPWVHLDIAGPSFASSAKPHREGGATGCMVRTLVELARKAPE